MQCHSKLLTFKHVRKEKRENKGEKRENRKLINVDRLRMMNKEILKY